MDRVLDFLDGKKTVIAALAMAIITALPQLGIPVNVTAEKITLYIGWFFTIVGIVHKLAKGELTA